MTIKLLILSNFIAAFTLFYIIHSITADSSYLCTKKYCEDATTQNPCEDLPKECNTTGKGIMMLEPSLCNCCDYCLVYLEEDDDCVYDGLSQPFHEKICGPGLGCDSATAKCIPLNTECTLKQQEFDESQRNGLWGFTQMRPLCDARGDYHPVHCIGSSICYCVNPLGERIFGEAVYTGPGVQQSMNCECSIANWKADKLAKEMGVIHNIPIHCLEDGSYDLLQCNDDMCRCLDSETKTPDNDVDMVLEINLRETNPECFDPDIHETGKYKRECEQELVEILPELELLKEDGITPVGATLPNCQDDGRYGRVLVNNSRKQCVDPDRNILQPYDLPPTHSLYEDMNCNCARTRWILQREGHTELPICCENGNFREMQCRRGKCYCVDCNGNQLGVEVDEVEKNQLTCMDTSVSCSNCPKNSISITKKSSFVIKEWDPSNDENFGVSSP